MAQYVKATNFASKDALLTGDPNKIVKGAEIDDEFSAIQTAVNSKADTLSPTLTGTPLAPTATAGTVSTQVATTAFVDTAVTNAKVSPAFTGTPTAPTAVVGTNTTQVATTAFVNAEIANDITAPLALKAPLASPALTGTPTAPTATAGTNTTQVATTAFVTTAVDNFVVQTGDIADSAVTTAKIANDAVTTAKIAPTGVSAGTYGSASAIPIVTVNAEGQVTSATTSAVAPSLTLITKTNVFSGTTSGSFNVSLPTSLFGGNTPSFVMFSASAQVTGTTDMRYFYLCADSDTPSNIVMGSTSDDTDQNGTGRGNAASTFVLPYAASQTFIANLYGAQLYINVIGYQL